MFLDRSRPTPLPGAPVHDISRRYVQAGLAALGAVVLFAGHSLFPSSDRAEGSKAPTGVVVVDAPRERPSSDVGPIREQASSPLPLQAPLPPDLGRRVANALGVAQAELHEVRRSEERDDAYCGEIATATQPARRRFVLLEQPFMMAIDDGGQGFADVALLCDA